jgi:hypothetical protein
MKGITRVPGWDSVGIIDPCTEKKFIDLKWTRTLRVGILQDILM